MGERTMKQKIVLLVGNIGCPAIVVAIIDDSVRDSCPVCKGFKRLLKDIIKEGE